MKRAFFYCLVIIAFSFNSCTTDGNTVINADEKTGTLTDIEGNTYAIVKIGEQWWMAENLKVTTYNDGTAIQNIRDSTDWVYDSIGVYCNNKNDVSNVDKYGRLYNWYAVNTAKLAPKGWHVPTNEEWTTLENYLIENGYNYDRTITGNKIAKSLAAKIDWSISTNTGAVGNNLTKNNSTGFSALPGGGRDDVGSFSSLVDFGNWWSATEEISTSNAWSRFLLYSTASLASDDTYKGYCLSVRCVRD